MDAENTVFQGFGCKKIKDGFYFGANISSVKKAGINFINLNTGKVEATISFESDMAIGNVYSCLVKAFDLKNVGYAYFADEKVFADPYANRLTDIGYKCPVSMLPLKQESLDKSNDKPLMIPFSDSVFYLCHVRGFSMADSASDCRGTFKYLGSKIPYLISLGVTSLILMPVYEFFGKKNYWGFCNEYYYALKSLYSSDSEDASGEFDGFVRKCHKSGLEVILTLRFDENASLVDICDVSKFYRTKYKVDGFRYIGGNIDVTAVSECPFLKDCKLLFENKEPQDFSGVSTARFSNIGLINDKFMNNARRFLKGDDDLVPYMSYAIRENSSKAHSLRYISDFGTFTLYDTVSYNRKHNEANSEDNRDGSDYNFSWNCGDEGPSKKKKVNALRMRQVRNAALITCLCQGAPMIVAGDEVLNSNNGNNNPYCQDNETGWVTWRTDKAATDFQSFLKNLLAFRKRHIVLHQQKELMLFDYMSCKTPDVSFHGEEAWKMDQMPSSREFGIMYCGDYSRQYKKETEDTIFIAYNMNWEERTFALPDMKGSYEWYLLYSTDGSTDESFDEEKLIKVSKNRFKAEGRSISILIQKKK